MGTPTLKRVNRAIILENGLVPPTPIPLAKKREEQVQLEKTTSGVNQYYGIRAVIALGVIGGLGYYIYRSKKRQVS